MNRTRIVAALFASCLAAPTLSFSAEAEEGHSAPSETAERDAEAASTKMLEEYAQHYELPEETAASQLEELPRLRSALIEVAADVNPHVAGVWIDHVPTLRGFVAVSSSGVASDELKSRAAALGVELMQTQRPSLHDAVERLLDAHRSLEDIVSTAAVALEYDEAAGEVVVYRTANSEPSAVALVVEEYGRLTALPVRLSESVWPDLGSDGAAYGGADATTCTVGFSVNGTFLNRDGLLTAGHCGSSQTYSGFNGITATMNMMSEVRDANADTQWHWTDEPELDDIWGDSETTRRDVTGQIDWVFLPTGDWACHRGRSTDYSCGPITSKSFQPTYANACPGTACAFQWIRMEGSFLKCFPGDSGGPVFFNSEFPFTTSTTVEAVGLYKGQSSSGVTEADCNWMVAGSIEFATGDLGVTLLS